jgi:hypothetical protein
MMPSAFSIEIDATPLFFRYFIVPGKTPEFVHARDNGQPSYPNKP